MKRQLTYISIVCWLCILVSGCAPKEGRLEGSIVLMLGSLQGDHIVERAEKVPLATVTLFSQKSLASVEARVKENMQRIEGLREEVKKFQDICDTLNAEINAITETNDFVAITPDVEANPLWQRAVARMKDRNQYEAKVKPIKANIDELTKSITDTFFSNLPEATATARTDADGKFALSVPTKGDFVLIAKERDKNPTTWMVRVNLDGKPYKQMVLSNDNKFRREFAESYLRYVFAPARKA
jgi:Xaa-Pro aminopeptidase